MKSFKRILSILLSVIIVFSTALLVGCGSEEEIDIEESYIEEIEVVETEVAEGIESGIYTYILKNDEATIIECHAQEGDIVIPSTLDGYLVTGIGEDAFSSSEIIGVTVPNSVTSIGKRAFIFCYDLTHITVDENNKNYSSDENGVLYNKDKTELIQYPTGNERTQFTIPDSVTSIGDKAFSGCDSLTSIKIPNSVTKVGEYAFFECSRLKDVTLSNRMTSISFGTFRFCDLTSITIPDSITSIGDQAFSDCHDLIDITIPDSVTSIGKNTFDVCYSLKNIVVDCNNQNYCSDEYGVLYNKDKTELIKYTAGSERTEYIIPDSVISVSDSAFGWCKSLTSIVIPDSVKSIGIGAFSRCTALTDIVIGNSVTSIDHCAFEYCDSLKDVTIPDSVTSMNIDVFFCCDSLTDIYYSGSQEQWEKLCSEGDLEIFESVNIHFNSK